MTDKPGEVVGLLLDERLRLRLERCSTLPTPPGVAVRIIELADDPGTSMHDIAAVVGVDPGMSAKLLRLANSPLFGRRCRIDNVGQAIAVLGLNETLVLALSCCLVNGMHAGEGGLDYQHFWRRSFAAAACCRVLAQHLRVSDPERYFLAGLLQDIGILALDRVIPDLYTGLEAGAVEHPRMVALERRAIGADHAAVGAWLLRRWNLPECFQFAAACSHDRDATEVAPEHRTLVYCAQVAGRIADLWWVANWRGSLAEAADVAARLLGIDHHTMAEILNAKVSLLRQTAALFDFGLGDEDAITTILEDAKEALLTRALTGIRDASELELRAAALEQRVRELEEANNRDALTGLYNRAYFDKALERELEQAIRQCVPISLVFVDLDEFKHVNDRYGHQVGDQVIKHAAAILTRATRATDIVARYGGDEFVIISPDADMAVARAIARRLVATFDAEAARIERRSPIAVTVSIGIATHGSKRGFMNSDELLRAADAATYAAKRTPGNAFVIYTDADTHGGFHRLPTKIT